MIILLLYYLFCYEIDEEMKKYYGEIPKDVYSICVSIQDLQTSNGGFVSGCPSLHTTLMCFETSCLFTGVTTFGCFSFNNTSSNLI